MNEAVTWKTILQQPGAWYKTAEAEQIARTVILYQQPNGGWEKNIDMLKPLPKSTTIETTPETTPETTIDNGATYTQVRFLAQVGTKECKESVLFGLNYLLIMQYKNGGWPQFYPIKRGYYEHITFNDDAMANVLFLLRDIAQKTPEFAFIDTKHRKQCEIAVRRGVECILRCQVVIKGKKTVWCAQHDKNSFAPAKARAYELPSLSGSESVPIVRFLMGEKPTKPIIDAIESAIAWFEGAKIVGIRVDKTIDDRIVVADASAEPLWGRFYDLETNKPYFCGRDGVKKNSLAEIEEERRRGYSYYSNRGNQLLKTDYPIWRGKLGK
jgi:PelA/Pel-15E family pectate lyase